MRLTCPNCGARYEVPDKVIPPQGRDVQCSNCDNSWFQAHDDSVAEDKAAAQPIGTAFSDAAEGPPPPRRKLDPTVSEILKQEAEREARLRRREAAGADAGSTSEPPGADPAASARKARARVAQMRTNQASAPQSDDAPLPQSSVLPNIAKISSTLRASDTDGLVGDGEERPRSGSGFARGITIIILLAAMLVLAYVNARTITEALPQAAPYVEIYVANVDALRVWLDGLIGQATTGSSEPLE